jgi:hypothetical protein
MIPETYVKEFFEKSDEPKNETAVQCAFESIDEYFENEYPMDEEEFFDRVKKAIVFEMTKTTKYFMNI